MSGERTTVIATAFAVVAVAGCLTFSCTRISQNWHEIRLACVQAGGTWVSHNSMCIAKGVEANICRGRSCQ